MLTLITLYRKPLVLTLLLLAAWEGLAIRPCFALISVAEMNARNAQKGAKKNSPHRSFRVVLDPGHGGIDHGTSYDSTCEKDVTLLLAKEVARQLRVRGIEVTLTREGDYEMPLAARTALATSSGRMFSFLFT